MKVDFLNLHINYQNIKEEVDSNIQKILNQNNYILGKEVLEFEHNFASYCNVKHCIGVGNGTDALEIALQSLELDCSDEVIVQGNTYVATCLGVLYNNYKLVLCDCDPLTYQISLDDLISKITPRTKVLLIVHLYGLISNMDEICNLCNEKNIILIEDSAQAHGAEWKGRKVGSFGKISCFSFYPGKNLGAYGDGGAICTNDDELDLKIRMLRNNGSIVKYHHDIIGRNSRLDTVQAAILNTKLKYLDENNHRRREIADLYNTLLPSNIKNPHILENSKPVYHLYVIQTDYREELQDYLKDHNIETLIHYPIPCSKLLALKEHCDHDPPVCLQLSNKILSLPIYPELEHDKVKYICNTITNFFDEKSKLIKLKKIKTEGKGGILNSLNSLNFNTKRIFYIDNFNKSDSSRGHHANKTCNEFIFVTNGSIKVKLTTTDNKHKLYYLNKNDGLLISAMTWLEFWSLQHNSSIVVLCDEEFISDGKKSIFDIKQFLKS